MGNFSRNTFDKLKHYVGVRLQQGVPLIDADWNEQEDIRKYELRAFLKWFVGNGVPKGNDGFRIQVIPLEAIPAENDFWIKGGDGTPEGAGRCLVEGWDAINESDLNYTAQPLFKNPALAAKWNVDPVPRLTTPTTPTPTRYRTDTVYLDVWEREVDAEEDYEHLVNPKIGIETCVRLKREWVVRVAEGKTESPSPPEGHVFYPLASLRRKLGVAAIDRHHIKDLRRSGLAVLSKELTIKDGNVGIGTTTPTSLLDVLLGSIRARRDADQYIQIIDNSASGGFIAGHSRANNKKPLYIESLHDGGEGPKGETQMRFRVGNETSPTTAITIKEDGNVGIGTTSPKEALQIGDLWTFHNGGHKLIGYNFYYGGDPPTYRRILQDEAAAIRFTSDGKIMIQTAGSGSPNSEITWNNALTVGNNGNVSIGTAQPEERLHVQGNIFASGLIYSGTRVLADRRENDVFQINPGTLHMPNNPPPYSVRGMDCVICLDVPAVINVYFNLDGLEFVEPGIGLLQCVRFLLYENDAEKESIRVGVQSNITISKVLELEAGEHSIEIKYAGCTLHGPRMLQTKGERRLLLHL